MEWHASNAKKLATIDLLTYNHGLAPAAYAVVRRAILASGDFDYLNSIHFSPNALTSGAAALAARTTIVVDDPMVQVGIVRTIQDTFANPVYCGAETITRPQRTKPAIAWGVETLARRYPEAIFVIGQSSEALRILVALIKAQEAMPAFVVAAPPSFTTASNPKQQLMELNIPNIVTKGGKGGACVAAAIVDGLLDLTWQAYDLKAAAQQRYQEQNRKLKPPASPPVAVPST
ncbi:MAG: precorrin-8X methylmutase [Synechococcus sp.]